MRRLSIQPGHERCRSRIRHSIHQNSIRNRDINIDNGNVSQISKYTIYKMYTIVHQRCALQSGIGRRGLQVVIRGHTGTESGH
jgi:hypothetical protein